VFSILDNLMHANALLSAAGWAFGRDGGSADFKNDLRDTKSPIIPLTVEMMMSANGDSDCDGDSPKKSWNRPTEDGGGGNSARAIKREGSSGKLHETENQRNSTPGADGSTDRMHLLQMASLFVEAAERQKQEDVVVEETPMEQGEWLLAQRQCYRVKWSKVLYSKVERSKVLQGKYWAVKRKEQNVM